MNTPDKDTVIHTLPDEILMKRIYVFRDQKVMLDRDLAELYGVETRTLKQAVRRNKERFPDDFMFELTSDEVEIMVSQSVIPDKKVLGGALPFVFSAQGVAMLSSVLKSKTAIQINIQIMRVFTKLRQFLSDNTHIQHEILEIRLAMEKLAKKQEGQDKNVELIFEYIERLEDKLETPALPERKRIGYKVGKMEGSL